MNETQEFGVALSLSLDSVKSEKDDILIEQFNSKEEIKYDLAEEENEKKTNCDPIEIAIVQ